MSKKILITGGASFSMPYLANFLIDNSNYEVTAIDCLDEQIYEKIDKIPIYLNKNFKFVRSSVNIYEEFDGIFKENDIIFHLMGKACV